ncbi:uncharacterized protein DC041_0008743 [Schistosoma bovis]|uniref:EF-hand domain-containing protein n=2 Tax=Schistosoma TaxID=6181 RepID=A0A430Q325_SCHBO|nr:uncharacterized protein DC041_0008743 [Schistosoma bovis]
MASKKSEKQFMLSENEFNQMAYDNTALMNPQYIDDIDYKNEIQPMNSQQTKSNQFINNADSDRYSCWSRFTHCIRSAWATRLTEDTMDNRELYIHTTLRELVIYIFFLITLMIVAYGPFNSNTYLLTSSMNTMFLQAQVTNGTDSLSTASSLDVLWSVIQGPIMNNWYSNTWYNTQPFATANNLTLLYQNRLIGVPRLRQLRMSSNSCMIPVYFADDIKECYGQYQEANEDKKPFGLKNGTAFKYLNFPVVASIGPFSMLNNGLFNRSFKYHVIQGPIMNNWYSNTWYNTQPFATANNLTLLYQNRLIGVPRLRQLRMSSNSCMIPVYFADDIKECYGQYQEANEDKKPFGLKNGTAWTYTSSDQLGMYSYWGSVSSYGGGGYYEDLSRDQTEAASQLDRLFQNLWLDRGTRVLFIHFTTYNPNMNLFSVVEIVVEVPASGSLVLNSDFRSVKLLRYVTPFDYFVLVCECAFLLFIAYYIVEEIMEIKKQGWIYFVSVWNSLDIIIILISIVCAAFNIYRTIIVINLLESILHNPNEFANFQMLSIWQVNFNFAISITVFLAWVKRMRNMLEKLKIKKKRIENIQNAMELADFNKDGKLEYTELWKHLKTELAKEERLNVDEKQPGTSQSKMAPTTQIKIDIKQAEFMQLYKRVNRIENGMGQTSPQDRGDRLDDIIQAGLDDMTSTVDLQHE